MRHTIEIKFASTFESSEAMYHAVTQIFSEVPDVTIRKFTKKSIPQVEQSVELTDLQKITQIIGEPSEHPLTIKFTSDVGVKHKIVTFHSRDFGIDGEMITSNKLLKAVDDSYARHYSTIVEISRYGHILFNKGE